jgi:ribosome-associated translation inhibitor RaiA
MVNVVFKNLEKSTMVRDIVAGKLERVLEKFPRFATTLATVSVCTENSRVAGPPHYYSVKLRVQAKGLRPIIVEKKAVSLYAAVAELTDHALEILHRTVEKRRDQVRSSRREWKNHQHWAISA